MGDIQDNKSTLESGLAFKADTLTSIWCGILKVDTNVDVVCIRFDETLRQRTGLINEFHKAVGRIPSLDPYVNHPGLLVLRHSIGWSKYSVEIEFGEKGSWCVVFFENSVGCFCGSREKDKRNNGELHFQGEAIESLRMLWRDRESD